MALAPFFDKTALAAAAVLQDFNREQFVRALDAQVVGVAFDESAARCAEGRTTLSLTVNLLARLYPRIAIRALGTSATRLRAELEGLASAINPNIEFAGDGADTDVLLVVGATGAGALGAAPATVVIYLGSRGWEARVSTSRAVGSGPTSLPFGAAAAACLGAANLFRHVFRAQLPGAALDTAVTLSTLSLESRVGVEPDDTHSLDGPSAMLPDTVDLGEAVLVGAGAVGQGVLWTLARASGLKGKLDVVDSELVDATNPQRYVLATSADLDASKVALAEALMHPTRDPARLTVSADSSAAAPGTIVRHVPATDRSVLQILPKARRWGMYLADRTLPFRLARVLVALDSARDRIAVQAALPRWIGNAWTQPGDLGLSRHAGFGDTACLACHYLPTGPGARNEDVIVAEAVGMSSNHMLVRQLLATGAPVDASVIAQMASGLGVPVEPLLAFVGRPLREFYSEAICGGAVLRLQSQAAAEQEEGVRSHEPKTGISPTPREQATHAPAGGLPADRAAIVPMAFQSVLAGVLLAAAGVADAAGLATPGPTQKAVINLLRPLPGRLLMPVAPHSSGKCLCQDRDFQNAFRAQWSDEVATRPSIEFPPPVTESDRFIPG